MFLAALPSPQTKTRTVRDVFGRFGASKSTPRSPDAGVPGGNIITRPKHLEPNQSALPQAFVSTVER